MASRNVSRIFAQEALLALAILGVLLVGALCPAWLFGVRLWLVALAALGIAILAFAALVVRRLRSGSDPKLSMLQRVATVAGIGVVAAVGFSASVLWLGGNSGASALRATVLERLGGETPQAQVNAYVRAVLRGDEEGALRAWALPESELPDGRSDALRQRREAITRQLIDAGLDQEFRIGHIEWWRTCCEPWVTNSERDAGGARIQVQFLDSAGAPRIYVFDVFNRDGAYWGGAMGYPLRHWALRDVYPNGEEPLYWRLVYEATVRGLPWPLEGTP